MAFATSARQDTMADINITPLVDVMLVLLVIFMATAPMLDLRIGVNDGVLKIDVSPDADYQSAATAMVTAERAGAANFGLVEH